MAKQPRGDGPPDMSASPQITLLPPQHNIRNSLHNAFQTQSSGLSNTGKGILIGMVSAFGSAAFVGIILAILYFFRYTSRGRILLDRMKRPGEFDDEQAFLREEEDALAEMNDLQRAEYLRAKGSCVTVRMAKQY